MADLARFVAAQDGVWPSPVHELAAGVKRGHWMCFVFPQRAGLGRSATARHFAIADLAEARAYLAHPILGPRLREAAAAVLSHRGRRSAEAIVGTVDAMKLRSSATLFERAAAMLAGEPFAALLDGFYAGERDALTLDLLG